MIKRSAVLLMLLAAVSLSLLFFSAHSSLACSLQKEETPVKCNDCSSPAGKAPGHWHPVVPGIIPAES